MSTENSNKLLLVGLPESGKTSFLAAFVNFVESDIPGKTLRQYQLSSNATYINLIIQSYLKGETQQRTRLRSTTTPNTNADIFLEKSNDNFRFTLNIPDVHGEIFENQFVDRFIDDVYLAQLSSATGLIVFIHPDHLRPAVLIEDIKAAHDFEAQVNQMQEGADATNQAEQPAETTAMEFKAAECPTQITLVDLLEAHVEFMPKRPVLISIIVSAWDLIKKDFEDLSPMKWIEKTLPLLYQYLLTNPDKIQFKTFGVSAVGGNLDNAEDLAKLTSLDEPTDRIIVQEENITHKNIGAPVEWIVEQWQSKTR